MMAVMYKVRLLEGKEEIYRHCWTLISSFLKKEKGALGSCLHKSVDGMWMVYSRWPDKKTYENGWSLEAEMLFSPLIRSHIELMRSCVVQRDEPLFFDVVEDKL